MLNFKKEVIEIGIIISDHILEFKKFLNLINSCLIKVHDWQTKTALSNLIPKKGMIIS